MARNIKSCNGTGPVTRPVTRSKGCQINESAVRTTNSKDLGVGPKPGTSTNKKDDK